MEMEPTRKESEYVYTEFYRHVPVTAQTKNQAQFKFVLEKVSNRSLCVATLLRGRGDKTLPPPHSSEKYASDAY